MHSVILVNLIGFFPLSLAFLTQMYRSTEICWLILLIFFLHVCMCVCECTVILIPNSFHVILVRNKILFSILCDYEIAFSKHTAAAAQVQHYRRKMKKQQQQKMLEYKKKKATGEFRDRARKHTP